MYIKYIEMYVFLEVTRRGAIAPSPSSISNTAYIWHQLINNKW